ncbi:alpha/beta fold hydrolase [uncultured Enterococcus sp.]|uniref:alpha/beta hydrolase n=1 Tax=uncultured Enterococcus sp. TaxID=167972 RepID=UPI002AA7C972|nr:alpha/beta fold hydrolase [uncultured Enterococcus sp.]
MKERALLIIHGFGGDEQEILYLHEHLKHQAMDSYWIRLTGHGEGKQAFAKATYLDWLNDVEQKIIELEQNYQKITCIGFSMGGLLTIQHSHRTSVDQIVLCSTPIQLYNFPVIVTDISQGLFSRDKERLNYYFSSTATPFKACVQFLKLLSLTKKRLKRGLKDELKANMLILQNKRDETTHAKSADYLWKISDCKASLHLYEGGTHQLFLGENKERAVKDLVAFVREKNYSLNSI